MVLDSDVFRDADNGTASILNVKGLNLPENGLKRPKAKK